MTTGTGHAMEKKMSKSSAAPEYSIEFGQEGDTYKMKSVTSIPPVPLKAGTTWHDHKVQFLTNLFGKDYYWMKDIDGTVYLAGIDHLGNPTLI